MLGEIKPLTLEEIKAIDTDAIDQKTIDHCISNINSAIKNNAKDFLNGKPIYTGCGELMGKPDLEGVIKDAFAKNGITIRFYRGTAKMGIQETNASNKDYEEYMKRISEAEAQKHKRKLFHWL